MKRITSIFLLFILSGSLFALPDVKTGNKEIDNLILLAQNEVQKNIRSDGTFCAGEQWPTAWTRDMSYAIDLSLYFLFPEAVEKSLESRIEKGQILQDTGSGGSWPVSTDRITWITAAYDYSLFKQNSEYFKKIYSIANTTLEKDFNVVYDEEKGIFRGESTFLDWREQTYPRWATNEYIAESYALGTNMMYYSAIQKTALLSKISGASIEETEIWENRARNLKKAIYENFWIPEKKYFSALLLKDIYTYNYQGYETLGESLGVILDIAPEDSYKNVTGAVEAHEYGLSVVAPQLDKTPAYHNDGVWPFVQGYRGLACKKAKDAFNAEKEFTTMILAAKKFGTFKENYVASNFTPDTQINSNRQLWSDAGFLAYIYRVIFGLDFSEKGISINPFVFRSISTPLELNNLTYTRNKISISIKGNGDIIAKYVINGKEGNGDILIPYSKAGTYKIEIEMKESEEFKNSYDKEKQVKAWFKANTVTPLIPNAVITSYGKTTDVSFKPKNKGGWKIIINDTLKISKENSIQLKPSDSVSLACAFALPEDNNPNIPLFPSKTIRAENTKNTFFIEAEKSNFSGGKIENDEGNNCEIVKLTEELQKIEANGGQYLKDFGKTEGEFIEFTVKIPKSGNYAIDFRFKNGHGPVNTGEKCALFTVSADEKIIRRLAFPQQGSWTSWNFTAPTVITLEKGTHKIKLYTDQWSKTQHDNLNPVHIDLMRIAKIK